MQRRIQNPVQQLPQSSLKRKKGKPPLAVRSSHRKCSIKSVAPKIFEKFTGKLLCHSLFLKKIAGLRSGTLFLKKETLGQVYSCKFREILRATVYRSSLWATASHVLSYFTNFAKKIYDVHENCPNLKTLHPLSIYV